MEKHTSKVDVLVAAAAHFAFRGPVWQFNVIGESYLARQSTVAEA